MTALAAAQRLGRTPRHIKVLGQRFTVVPCRLHPSNVCWLEHWDFPAALVYRDHRGALQVSGGFLRTFAPNIAKALRVNYIEDGYQ